jgi:hypothetical protein
VVVGITSHVGPRGFPSDMPKSQIASSRKSPRGSGVSRAGRDARWSCLRSNIISRPVKCS